MTDATDQLRPLIVHYLDGTCSDADAAALNRLLRDDPGARRAFMSHCELAVLVAECPSDDRGRAERSIEEPLAEPVIVANRWKSASFAAAAVLLLAAFAVAFYSFAMTPNIRTPVDPDVGPIATLVDADTAVLVNGEPANSGEQFRSGEYAIESGSAEFLLSNRVTVQIEGNTRLNLHNLKSVSLPRGQASFDVPHGVEGFTVQLPDRSRIVDLGTTFRVRVDDAGRAELRVLAGRVEWVTPDAAAERVRIAAGQAARLVNGRPIVSDVTPIFTERFDGFAAPEEKFNGGQYQSNLVLAVGGTLPGWNAAGFGAVHAVDHQNAFGANERPHDFAVMIFAGYDADQANAITSDRPIVGSNAPATTYEVSFLASPAVYMGRNEATAADDGLLVEVIRGDGSVLASYTARPGVWAGDMNLHPEHFEYVGDGSGDIRLRIGPATPAIGRFGGAIDDLTLSVFKPQAEEPGARPATDKVPHDGDNTADGVSASRE